jgi:hypothetical protein
MPVFYDEDGLLASVNVGTPSRPAPARVHLAYRAV